MSTQTDPVRQDIKAAMDRLLAGTPERSTGRLSVAQLAREAGVKRWHLTHQHVDLKDDFQARVRGLDATRAWQAATADELEALQLEHAELRRHCAGLEERLRTYATVLNLLSLENAALADSDAGPAPLLPFPRRDERPAGRARSNRRGRRPAKPASRPGPGRWPGGIISRGTADRDRSLEGQP